MTELALRPSSPMSAASTAAAADSDSAPIPAGQAAAPASTGSPAAVALPPTPAFDRSIFAGPAAAKRHRLRVALLGLAAIVIAIGLLAWDNPMPFGSEGF